MPPPGRKPTTLSFVPRGQENCPFYPLLKETRKPLYFSFILTPPLSLLLSYTLSCLFLSFFLLEIKSGL